MEHLAPNDPFTKLYDTFTGNLMLTANQRVGYHRDNKPDYKIFYRLQPGQEIKEHLKNSIRSDERESFRKDIVKQLETTMESKEPNPCAMILHNIYKHC